MACPITSGKPLACRDSKGGVNQVWLIEHSKVSLNTVSGSLITSASITPSSDKFLLFEQEIEKANFTNTIQVNRGNYSVYSEQSLTLYIYKGDADTMGLIKSIAANKLMATVKDNNGVYYTLGAVNGLTLDPSTFNTGTAFADMNGYELKFMGKEPEMAYVLSPTVAATILE
jgi:hypothetical protein